MEKTFSSAFIEHLEETGEKVTEISKKSGVPKDALYSLKYGKTLNMGVDDAIKVAAAFDKNIYEFMGIPINHLRDGLSEKVSRLTDRERALLEASLGAILADGQLEDPEDTPDKVTTSKPDQPKDS